MNCQICDEFIDKHIGDSHHLIKRSKGGQDWSYNQRDICTRCHRMIHVAERMILKAKSPEQVKDYLRSRLVQVKKTSAVENSVALLYDAAKIAAFEKDPAEREMAPVALRLPVALKKEVALAAYDRRMSMGDLIILAVKEYLKH